MKADIKTIDRGEPVSTMEPLLLGDGPRHRGPSPWNPCSLGTAPGTGGALTDLALDLAQISAGFRRSLPHSLLTSLADLVRSMNCYYSNLIEGHDTHPVDIERALKKRLPARMPASATCSSKPRHTSPCSSGSITGPPRRPCRQSRRNL